MNQSTFRIALLVMVVMAITAPAIPDETDPIPEVSAERMHAHLAFLADDRLEGRDTGSKGYDVAANYVAAHFRRLGLEPAGTDGYLQPIEFVRVDKDPDATAIVLHFGDEATRLVRGDDFVERPSPFSDRTQVTAEVVFVGYGVHAPEEGIDDFASVDLTGKIAVALSGAPASLPSEKRAHYSARSTKRQELINRGAVGALAIRTRTDAKRYSWDRILHRLDQPVMFWRRGDAYPNDVNPSFSAQAALSPTGAAALFEHAPVELDEILDAAELGPVDGFVFKGLKATIAIGSRRQTVTSPNVAAILPGSDPGLSGEYVLYSGHLDHVGRGRPEDGDDIYNGFYDNAMGISLMMEVAEVMASRGQAPARSILFLAVTGEEKGLLGSEYYARYPTVPADSIVANVNLDMPLLMYPISDLNAFGSEHSTLGPVVEESAERLGLELSPDPMPEEVLFVRSDQYSFVKHGIPAVYLKPGFGSSDPEVNGAAVMESFRKTHYHRPSDDSSLPVDESALELFAQVNVLIGEAIANDPQRPRWHEGNFFGELFGR